MKTIWFTGLPCSGKTTLADALRAHLVVPTVRLDGDHVREGLSVGLGWTPDGRNENIRRCAEVAQLLNEQGVIVIASFITPMAYHRRLVKEIVKDVDVIYVNTPAHVCEERDVKGLWEKARRGKIRGFTGYDACYEEPTFPEAYMVGTDSPVEEIVSDIITECLAEVL